MSSPTPGIKLIAALTRPARSPRVRRWLLRILFLGNLECREFLERLNRNYDTCDWQPHPEHSVFTQYDGPTYYVPHREGFLRKYRWMYAVARTIDPKKLIELGTHAGSSADAYLSASRSNRGEESNCQFIGIDLFDTSVHPAATDDWRPLEVAERLFEKRRFANFRFVSADLRALSQLEPADMVVVDAAHDFANALADMNLALTANPRFLFIDDVNGWDVFQAWMRFYETHGGRIAWFCKIDYPDGGLVVKIKQPPPARNANPPGPATRFLRRHLGRAVAW